MKVFWTREYKHVNVEIYTGNGSTVSIQDDKTKEGENKLQTLRIFLETETTVCK